MQPKREETPLERTRIMVNLSSKQQYGCHDLGFGEGATGEGGSVQSGADSLESPPS